MLKDFFNPFVPNAPFLYPLKTCFQRVEKRCIGNEWINLKEKSLFAIHDPAGVKLLLRLRLKFSHLNELKLRHNFKGALSPMCDCGSETEITDHFFLRCPFFVINRQKLLNTSFFLSFFLSFF